MSQTEESRWFSENVAQHETALRAYLLKRFPALPDHDDIVQETYAKILRAWKLGRLTHTKGFLFATAKNAAIDLIRRHREHESIVDDKPMPLLEEGPGLVELVEHDQLLHALVEAVATLPERCREVMMLRYMEGRTYKEIARELGISTETVKIHLIKGVRDCTHYFRQRGLLEPPVIATIAS